MPPQCFTQSILRLALLFLLLPIGFSPPAGGQSPARLTVDKVQFSLERSPYGGQPWLEMELEIDVRANANPAAANRDFLDDLKVEVAMAQNLGIPSRPRLEYFWTLVELPTLQRGGRRLRFYLPPEQVERGRIINDDPYAWYVRIYGGNADNDSRQTATEVVAVSGNLREQPRLDRFLQLLEAQKEKRTGILLPQAETPFRDAYPNDTPTIKGQVRKE